MRKNARTILSVAAIAAFAAGGSAFTASNTMATGATVPHTGYVSTSVSGATVNTLHYNLDATGANVDSVTLVLSGNTTTDAVSIGFNGANVTSCGTGTFSTGTPGSTSYSCDDGGASFTQPTDALTDTAVVVN
jgi:hypothetical protein